MAQLNQFKNSLGSRVNKSLSSNDSEEEEEDGDEQERLQKRAEKYSKIASSLKNTTQKSYNLKTIISIYEG